MQFKSHPPPKKTHKPCYNHTQRFNSFCLIFTHKRKYVKMSNSFMRNEGKTCQGAPVPSDPEPSFWLQTYSHMFSPEKVSGDDINYPVAAPWYIVLLDKFFELQQIVWGNDNALHQYNRWHVIFVFLLFNSHFYHQYSHQCAAVNVRTDLSQRQSFANFKNIRSGILISREFIWKFLFFIQGL